MVVCILHILCMLSAMQWESQKVPYIGGPGHFSSTVQSALKKKKDKNQTNLPLIHWRMS